MSEVLGSSGHAFDCPSYCISCIGSILSYRAVMDTYFHWRCRIVDLVLVFCVWNLCVKVELIARPQQCPSQVLPHIITQLPALIENYIDIALS